jgi:Na+-transporting NADH:ubiquinone oxidoreductase subunit C
MNTQSNTYTFIYSSIIVLIVATLLAIMASALKPAQEKNIEIEKKQNILASLKIESTKNNVEKLYDQYIVDKYTINADGHKVENVDPFYINLREELKKPQNKRNLPVFISKKNDTTFLIIPVYGKGLWGPIWGYISLLPEKSDTVTKEPVVEYSTIYGAFFDHKGETPGLGAEIAQPAFQLQFTGKKIFDKDANFISIKVVKGGVNPSAVNEVDAISGGTITSKGVQAMMDTCMVSYKTFLKSEK